MKFSFTTFIKDQWSTWPPAAHADLGGQKAVIVTGANIGIGREAAKHFARMNPGKLILACRSKGRGEAALTELKTQTGFQNAEVWLLDLSNFASVKAFADKFNEECERLDILVENAATIPSDEYSITPDGWESTFQVNNLSTSLLGLLLLPRMIETADKLATTPRLVVVSSDTHLVRRFGPDMMDTSNPLETFGKDPDYIKQTLGVRYQDSKLLNTFFARALSNRISGGKVIVNSVNPGYCYSNIRAPFKGFRKLVGHLMEIAFARTSEEGSRHLVWAAVGGEDNLKDLQGAYISMARISEASDYVISEEGQQHEDKLWHNLVDELIKINPEVEEIVNKYLITSS